VTSRRGTYGFTAGGKALHQTAGDEQQRRCPADRVVTGQHADGGGGGTDGEQGEVQDAAAADAVTELTEKQAADRAGDERHTEGGEGGEHADELVALRAEGVRERDGRQGVQGEVVELDELSHAAAEQHAFLHGGRARCGDLRVGSGNSGHSGSWGRGAVD